jgi:streptomycin 6-kinase
VLKSLLEEWALTPDGEARSGACSFVYPVRTSSGTPAALKLGRPDVVDAEGQHEHLALQRWAGSGAVRLLRADPGRRAMLLERLHDEDLGVVDDLEACEVVAALYAQLHVPALPQLVPLTAYIDRWTADLAALPRSAPVPRRMVEQAVTWGRDFCADPESVGVLIHGDLHYANVLAADRAPWLAIDPKPMSGDPHYEPAPMLWNRWDAIVATHDVRAGLRRRFHTIVDTAELDEVRARRWVGVRMMHNALWALEAGAVRGDVELTRCVTIAKAVSD